MKKKKKKKSSGNSPQKIIMQVFPQNASPVCYAQSNELREEYKDKK